MLFTGDIAAPGIKNSVELSGVFGKYPKIFKDKTLICNFEGLIHDSAEANYNKPVLYNHQETLRVLKARGSVVAGLANNHILDLPLNFNPSIKIFEELDIIYTGAGTNKPDAEQPVQFEENGRQILLFNACWDFLMYNQQNPSNGIYVAEIDEKRLIKQVGQAKAINKNISIVVFLHWNFDLETLPFPMHRQFAKDLIDAGANLVVGSHSHCVQGGEKYNDGYIVYGLGNFFIPHNVFANGKIKYPSFSNTELVLEWEPKTNKAICHWFEYKNLNEEHTLNHLGSEDFETSERLKSYSPFNGLTDDEYFEYFKKHRRKKVLIPIYKDYNAYITNKMFTFLLKNRARVARLLAKHGVIKWQN
jgi:poly-gamma-glutamate synthesis protein (capsule biosynthesis protein)